VCRQLIYNASLPEYFIRTLSQAWAAFPTMLSGNFAATSNNPLPQQENSPEREPIKEMSVKSFKELFSLLVVLALAACGVQGTVQPTQSAEPAKPVPTRLTAEPTIDPNIPVKGGTVTVGTAQEPGTLSPLLAVDQIDDVISAFIVEGLVGTDTEGNYVPVLAESLPSVSEDGLVLTYNLKKGITWSDGNDFVCADVQFTLDAILSELSHASTSGYGSIEGIECSDDYTAVVTMASVYAPHLRLFSYILPRMAGDLARMDNWEYNRAPIGTGPWIVKEWKAGDHIELAANPYYREEGKPYLDKLIIRVLPSREVGMQLLDAGEITVLWDLTEADFAAIESMAGVTWAGTLYGAGENELLVFNLGPTDGSAPAAPSASPHPILSDLRVRQAFQYAIDKQLLVDTLLFGNVKIGTTVLPTGPFACPQPASEFSPNKAKALLEEAGWKVGDDGIREKDGLRMSLEISTTTGNQLREQTEQVLSEMLHKVGIELVIKNMPRDMLFSTWDADGARNKGRFDILMYTIGPFIDPDSHLFNNYHSARIPQRDNNGMGSNFSRYINADVDQWIDEAATTANMEKRKELYCKVAEQINKDLPRIFLYERLILSGYRETLQNFRVSPGSAGFTIASQNWWLKK
jgi:peptide/nickel transport system substrate-binding protein